MFCTQRGSSKGCGGRGTPRNLDLAGIRKYGGDRLKPHFECVAFNRNTFGCATTLASLLMIGPLNQQQATETKLLGVSGVG